MNYEAGSIGGDARYALPDGTAPRRRRRGVIAALAVVLLAVLGWFLFGTHKGATKPDAKALDQLPTVSVGVPGHQAVQRVLSATGTLAAKREMPVGIAGEGGRVNAVLVEPGTWVQAGQVLATIDRSVQAQTAEGLAASINVARADAAIAQSELDRAQALVDRGFISKADLERKRATRDAANARVRVAQASLAETRARNGRLDIRAPAAGLVLTRQVEPGQIVSPASGTLFRMAKEGQLELQAQLSEADLQAVHAGAPAQVTPVGGDRAFSGVVWQVSPVIDPQTRLGLARIQLGYNPALRPGGFASATIVGGSTQAPLLPNSALQNDEKGSFVYIVDAKHKVARRDVKLGDVSDRGVVVVRGLNGDERVVLSAGAFLSPGQEVKPMLQKMEG